MPYARLDDRYDDHRKIKRAWRRSPAAVALHAMAITYANRHCTDGLVDVDWVEEKLALLPCKPAQREAVTVTLLELGLFEREDEDHFRIHDFLDWNLSRDQRARLAEQGRRGGRARSGGSSGPGGNGSSLGLDEGLSEGLSEGPSDTEPTGSSTPSPRHATPRHDTTTTALRADVVECFAYWQERCGHPQAKLTGDREARLKARLREGYTVHEIRRAIDGAAHGAFVNDVGRRFDDIELICRSGSKLEGFVGRAGVTAGNVVALSSRERKVAERGRLIERNDDGIPA